MLGKWIEDFVEGFTAYAGENGISQVRYYIETVSRSETEVRRGHPESLYVSHTSDCFIEGNYQGLGGCVYVEDFSDGLFAEHVRRIKDVAVNAGRPYRELEIDGGTAGIPGIKGIPGVKGISGEAGIPGIAEIPGEAGGCDGYPAVSAAMTAGYVKSDGTRSIWSDPSERLAGAEKAAYESDDRIYNVYHMSYEDCRKEVILINEAGKWRGDASSYGTCRISVEAKEGERVQIALKSIYARDGNTLDLDGFAAKACREAAGMLDAGPVATGRYRVILHNSVMGELISAFLPGFGADKVGQGLSRLKERIGAMVAVESFNLIEDPFCGNGIITRHFDDEGCGTARKYLVEKGVLKTYLYNREQAEQAGIPSTGNGFKKDFKSDSGIYVTNLLLEPGNKDLQELMEEMGNGILIMGLDGVFAGADPVSGSFSLLSRGYLVEKGRIRRGVSQITIGGNFYDLIEGVKDIGNDLAGFMGEAPGYILSPSVYVSELVVSGT